jgi:hypothetical protein
MINPLNLTSLMSLDLGDIQSSDGRSHPLTAMTPAYVSQAPDDCSQYAVGSFAWQKCQAQRDVASGIAGSSAPQNGGSGPTPSPTSGGSLVGKLFGADSHGLARVTVIVIGVGILLIVVFKFAK